VAACVPSTEPVEWDAPLQPAPPYAPQPLATLSAAITSDERASRALASSLCLWVETKTSVQLSLADLCAAELGAMADGLVLAQIVGEGTRGTRRWRARASERARGRARPAGGRPSALSHPPQRLSHRTSASPPTRPRARAAPPLRALRRVPAAPLAGALEGRAVSGLTHNVRAGASCRHNCERSLMVLRLRPNMPLDHLYSADALAKGDAAVFLGLLAHIRRAYGPALRPAGLRRQLSAPSVKTP
jgi:hypothetical protein